MAENSPPMTEWFSAVTRAVVRPARDTTASESKGLIVETFSTAAEMPCSPSIRAASMER